MSSILAIRSLFPSTKAPAPAPAEYSRGSPRSAWATSDPIARPYFIRPLRISASMKPTPCIPELQAPSRSAMNTFSPTPTNDATCRAIVPTAYGLDSEPAVTPPISPGEIPAMRMAFSAASVAIVIVSSVWPATAFSRKRSPCRTFSRTFSSSFPRFFSRSLTIFAVSIRSRGM